MTHLIYAQKNEKLIETLLHRRSVPVKLLTEPGPNAHELETILAAAMRTPDHGKLFPWWFIVFEGDKRAKFGEVLKIAWAARDANATPAKLDDEQSRLLKAPLVVAVISSPRESAIPVLEQILSAGAVCQNMLLAANALGYGANWLTNWCAYDDNVRAALKLRAHENIAGFLYFGTAKDAPEERTRPDPEKLINHDFENTPNRGDEYAKTGLGFIGYKF